MTVYERFLNTKNAFEKQVGWTKYVSEDTGNGLVKVLQYELDFLNEKMDQLTLEEASTILN